MGTYPPPVCVDDFGSNVYRCHWTGKTVVAEQAVVTGSYVTGIKMAYVSAPGYEAARKESYCAFADSERNCNTCRHLERVKHPQDPLGFLVGRCASTPMPTPQHFIPPSPGLIKFHPDDPMHMTCYESRFNGR